MMPSHRYANAPIDLDIPVGVGPDHLIEFLQYSIAEMALSDSEADALRKAIVEDFAIGGKTPKQLLVIAAERYERRGGCQPTGSRYKHPGPGTPREEERT